MNKITTSGNIWAEIKRSLDDGGKVPTLENILDAANGVWQNSSPLRSNTQTGRTIAVDCVTESLADKMRKR